MTPVTRREFARRALGTAFGSALLSSGSASPVAAEPTRVLRPGLQTPGPTLDAGRVAERMAAIARIGATPEGGGSRTAGSDADLEARAAFSGWMEAAGMGVRTDLAGNLVGRLPGSEPGLAPLLSGSHLDSVPDGGNFDGVVGCVGALECAAAFSESGERLRHPLEVVVFFNEENGKTGSRAWAGEVAPEEMDLPAYGGRTIGEALRRVGGAPDRIADARIAPGAFAGCLELHIEQGPTLRAEGIQIGAVEGIVGIRRFRVRVLGAANHAGTTAMGIRRDPMVTAGRFIAAVNDVAVATPGRHVATVGRVEARPGAANVIPGEVELTLEIRDLRMDAIDDLFQRLRREGEQIAARNGTTIEFAPYYLSRAAPCDPEMIELVSRSAAELGLSSTRMPSGAGHDTQSLVGLAPIGMIFVPSVDGISHSPREFTETEDVVNGARVLAASLRALDRPA